jgi:hypothetical protein
MSISANFPILVQEELALFGVLCDTEPARGYFAE